MPGKTRPRWRWRWRWRWRRNLSAYSVRGLSTRQPGRWEDAKGRALDGADTRACHGPGTALAALPKRQDARPTKARVELGYMISSAPARSHEAVTQELDCARKKKKGKKSLFCQMQFRPVTHVWVRYSWAHANPGSWLPNTPPPPFPSFPPCLFSYLLHRKGGGGYGLIAVKQGHTLHPHASPRPRQCTDRRPEA